MTAPEAQPATSPETPAGAATPTMHIGALAERTGMSLRTLRHYDETGLLEPSGRTEGGFRLYTERDLSRLLVIRRMKPLGFSLDEMADLLDVVDQLRADTCDAGTEGPSAAGGAVADGETSSSGMPGDASDNPTSTLRARLDAYVESAEARRAELARKLDMADEFISLLRST